MKPTGVRRSPAVGRRSQDLHLRAEFLRLKAALHDPNTGLDATAAVLEAARALFQTSRAVGLIHVEVDPLARVETVYGWQLFDRILKTVADEIRSARETPLPAASIVCQAGICADRFLVLVPLGRGEVSTRPELLDTGCRALQDRLTTRFSGSDFRAMSPRPTFSIGCAVVAEHPFYRLERQLYRAIDDARQSGMRAEAQVRGRQHAELKRIIRDQQIETVFQPIVDLETRRIFGYEALSRGPSESMFEAPATLFECSREVGMSGELDRCCQRAALRQARRLSRGDKLFLNALPSSLLDPGFREGLLAELPEDYPIACSDIVLEIADRNGIVDDGTLTAEVADLRSLGFRVSVDDVGRNASSLERLADVRPDFIKVDVSLVRNIHRNLIKQGTVRSICELAREIESTVIAEGIETREELDALRQCGVRYGQGYLLFRPSRNLPARPAAGKIGN